MTLDPKNLAATAVRTFGDEFDSFRPWTGRSGWDVTGGPQWSGRVNAAGTLPYNNELQWYVDPGYQAQPGAPALPNPFSVAAGQLAITARPADASLQPSIGGQHYTSGIITTFHEFAQTYGYFEMRAQMPAGQGLWPAFWLLPVDGSWPPELDVMEMLGHQATTLHTTVHSKVSGAQRDSATHYETTAGIHVADMTTGFHDYGVDWEPDHIAWYFDGQEVFRAATPADMNKPMYMVANLAVGGDWPGSPNGSTSFPATMKIDYVRAYAAKPLAPVATDTAAFAFKLTEARFSYEGGTVVVDGPDGSHIALSGTKHLAFADGTVNQGAGSGLVDDLFYFDHNRDVWAAHLDATQHFSQYGWQEGRDPNAYFSAGGYLAANPGASAGGPDPLTQYHQQGWKAGNDPGANFDTALYLLHNPDVKAAGIDPLQHFLQYGQAEGRQAYAAVGPSGSFNHGSFDAEFYLLANADVAKAVPKGGDAFAFAYQHYQNDGWHEGRNPNAYFDVKGYLNAYGDVKAAGIDPLQHYDQYGWKEGRDPSAVFDTHRYEAHYTDVAAAHLDPLQHFLQYGIYEGRGGFADGHIG